MNIREIGVVTDTNGDFSVTTRITGEVLAVGLEIGDLSTPDVTIVDSITGESVFAKTGIAASDTWTPRRLATSAAGVDLAAAAGPPAIDNVFVPTTVFRGVTVTVAGAGSIKAGRIFIAYRG